MSIPFTHLHVHSEYSLLDGLGRISELVGRAKALGMDSLALTDHGVLFGAVDFYKACRKEGIRPVIGCEVYVAPKSMYDKEKHSGGNYYHLILLAENNTGWRNLCKIVSIGFTDGFYYKPRVDHGILRRYHEGLICLSGCIAGEIPRAIINDQQETAEKLCLEYLDIFGENNFFLEIQDHRMPEEAKANAGLIRLSQKYGIPLVATNDAHYVMQADAETHDVLLCIQTLSNVDDDDRMRFPGNSFYLKSPEEMAEAFPDQPQAIANTHAIAERCHVTFDLETAHLPAFTLPAGFNNAGDYVRYLCEKGMRERYDVITPELKERMDYELSVIHTMGFDNYFLVVWDFIKYAKDHDIMVGPGRGSAAGSLVAYALDITTLDPIKYNLLFERFLNPERVTMPDIDCDFCYERRQEVIDYVIRKYGSDRVAQIITFGTMAARAAVRDVGRALGMTYGAVDVVAKLIPNRPGQNISIAEARTAIPELKTLSENDSDVARLLDTASQLEGLARHASTHAAGVVIADAPLTEYVPLYRNGDAITTQFPMGLLEDLGLIKMDFLGLRTLTVIRDAVANIRKDQGIEVDINRLDMNDPKVYALLSGGDTLGVFQLESAGMIRFMRELAPQHFEDIIAGISLYRPGPMEQIPRYIAGKKDPSKIRYLHPLLEPILSVTYGCMVYQEQVMQIFRELAGFSMGRSDLVRRAMSKKKIDVMDHEGQVFIHGERDEEGNVVIPGAVSRGVPESVAKQIYAEMKDFAKYAFNKSHAAAYAVVAYQTAWLKCHYPVAFMAALMSSVMSDEKKVADYIEECKKMGIEVMPPDVNTSEGKFTCVDGKIVFGLMAIKGIGEKPAQAIVEARERGGVFKSFADFCERVDLSVLNKRAFDPMIKAGAFDFLGISRARLLGGYENIVNRVIGSKRNRLAGQMSLLDFGQGDFHVTDVFPDVQPALRQDILADEKAVLGLYISGHPLEAYADMLKKITTFNASMVKSGEELLEAGITDGDRVVVGGLVDTCRQQMTKKGQMMAFVTLEDLYGKLDVVVFPKVFSRYKMLLDGDAPVIIRGHINVNEESLSILADEIGPVRSDMVRESVTVYDGLRQSAQQDVEERPTIREEKRETQPVTPADAHLIINLQDISAKPLIARIKPALAAHPGNTPVILRFIKENKRFGAGKNLQVTVSDALIAEIEAIVGSGQVRVM